MTKRRILLIDDEEDFCLVMKLSLEGTGEFEVSTATSGDRGINLARRYNPDFILLDIMMPGKDGFAVLKIVKEDEKTRHIPVIMLTAKVDASSKEKAASLSCDDYITKPVELEELKARIERVIEKRSGIL